MPTDVQYCSKTISIVGGERKGFIYQVGLNISVP